MKLILTNDDGLEAPGLKALENALGHVGELVVVAPEFSQSEIGHQVTTNAPIRVRQISSARYGVSGTPADCARIALTVFHPDADWLIAGINRGGNLGADTYISGTVAAAREAALLGIRAIAVSHYVAENREVDWTLAVRRAAPVLKKLIDSGLEPACFFNVNLPHPPDGFPDPPVSFCTLDTMPLAFHFRREGDQYVYRGNYHQRPRQQGRDVDMCFSGRIAVSKIPLEMADTHHAGK